MSSFGRPLWERSLPFVSFLLLSLAWALGLPLNGAPDELDHVNRAAAVARGELVARSGPFINGTGGLVTAPEAFRELASPSQCFAFHGDVPASCRVPGQAVALATPVASGAARYFPLFYLATGLPSLPFPTALGWYLMRVVSAAVNALLLAGAFASAGLLARGVLARLGVLASATPMTLFLGGAVNVNSWEISGAIGVWMAGLALLLAPAAPVRTLVIRMTGAGILMVTSRGLSPLWLALVGAVLLISVPPARIRAVLAAPAVRRGLAALLGAALVAMAWNQWQQSLDIGHNAQAQLELGRRLWTSLRLSGVRLEQMVGFFGWLDTPPPAIVDVAWTAVLGALVLLGLAGGRPRLRLALLATAGLAVVVPTLIEAATANRFGFAWQGRYTLPLAVGVPLVAAAATALDLGLRERAAGTLALLVAGTLGVAHVAAVWVALLRFQAGLGHTINPLAGSWHPPVGPAPVLALSALGALGLFASVARAREAPLA